MWQHFLQKDLSGTGFLWIAMGDTSPIHAAQELNIYEHVFFFTSLIKRKKYNCHQKNTNYYFISKLTK